MIVLTYAYVSLLSPFVGNFQAMADNYQWSCVAAQAAQHLSFLGKSVFHLCPRNRLALCFAAARLAPIIGVVHGFALRPRRSHGVATAATSDEATD